MCQCQDSFATSAGPAFFLLQRLPRMHLPVVLVDPRDIECIALLSLAGFVKAQVHPAGKSFQSFAIVASITIAGRQLLASRLMCSCPCGTQWPRRSELPGKA